MKYLISCVFALAFCSPVLAQNNCAPREVVKESLVKKFGEVPQLVALTSDGKLFEFFGSLESRTWTVVITTSNNISCIVSTGSEFESVFEKPVVKGPAL